MMFQRALFLAAILAAAPAVAQEANPAVTVDTLRSTICVPGWTKTVRPPASMTNAIKAKFIRRQGTTRPMRDFELDHIIPLCLGGAPRSERNLQLQPWPEAKRKDKLEAELSRKVCAGDIPLAKAQKLMKEWRPK
jgi:hypothetical protein